MKTIRPVNNFWNYFGNVLGFLTLVAFGLGVVAIIVWLWRVIFRI
jgi:hypothetical protein